MEYKVLKKQNNSDMCFVCGMHNNSGLHAHFYEVENEQIVGLVNAKDIHQSYPMRMHGGIITSLLDEAIGRAIQIGDPDAWGVTIDINVRFKKPVPLHDDLKAVGKITSKGRIFIGEGYICDSNNEILATCSAKYMKLPVSAISDGGLSESEWFYVEASDKILSIDLPQ